MKPVNHLNAEEKLLFNGLLFCELRLEEKIENKLTNIEKYLTKGVDINTQDANDNNNTPLHIAVMKDEPEIVEFLLQKGANPKANNKNKQTPIDIAILCQNKNKNRVINILRASIIYNNKIVFEKKLYKNALTEMNLDFNKKYRNNGEVALINDSRSGTAGISGHFYEYKLCGLLLHRALNDYDIEEFYIGSNLTGLGAFDDIVFKYKLRSKESPVVVFVQAKHKEEPGKNKLTVESVLNTKKILSLDKYFISYLKIKQKMKQKNKNVMFQNDECKFIIYTAAMEEFHKKRLINSDGKESLLPTSDQGKSFMYDYDDNDVEALLKNVLMLEAKSLAKCFALYINRHKYENMLLDELIGIYHVFIAQYIVQISDEKFENYVTGSFRKSFLETRDEILVHIKETMFKEMKMQDELSKPSDEITKKFKLPKYFGNSEVPFNDGEYVNLWKVIKLIIEHGKETKINENNITMIVVDDNMVGKIINSHDMNSIRYLVGETLIFDDETGWFKFNLELLSSDKNRRLLAKLKSNVEIVINLSSFRFEINVQNFPQLSFRNETNKKKNLTDFLKVLQFHTNQATENELEDILKNEIISLYHKEHKNSNSFYQINGDTIYLNYYDRIQKWCRKTEKKYYLTTKSRTYYEEAKESVLNSPLLNNSNNIYVNKINSLMLNFDQSAVDDLGLQAFMDRSDVLVLNIITKDMILTSVKIKQYFNDNNFLCYFVDLDIESKKVDNEVMLKEISDTMMDVIIFTLSEASHNIPDCEMKFIKPYNKKVIVISHSKNEILKMKMDCLEQTDERNSLCDFDKKTQERIVQQRNIFFQGSKVPFASLVDVKMYNLVKGDVLHRVMKNDVLEIGKVLTSTEAYFRTKECYVDRRICRCLKLREQCCKDFIVIDNNGIADAEIKKDILIISNDIDAFNKNCEKHSDKNVHWFRKQDDKIIWIKSNGSIKKLVRLVERIKCDENDKCSLKVKLLTHLIDRVVIINAGPGMGKSTLLAHLINETKYVHGTQSCIIKFNLLDLKTEFSAWLQCDDNLRLGRFMSVLYKSFSFNEKVFLNDVEFFDNITFVDYDGRIHIRTSRISKIHELTIFEFQYFLNLYNNKKITLLFDGFDEICPDYKKVAIELFKLLLTSRIEFMWITTRPMNLNELECEMNTFYYILKGFTINDQIEYLEKILTSETSILIYTNLYATQFLGFISNTLTDSQKDFTSVPLHLSMIWETFQECCPTMKTLDGLNLSSLYKKFINKKFDEIRFGEKKDALTFKDSDMITVKEEQRISFIESHKLIAAYCLLHTKIKSNEKRRTKRPYCKDNLAIERILTKGDLKHIRDLLQTFSLRDEKTGIIETVAQNEPKFVHLTYAEYFASEFLCDRVRQRPSMQSTSNYLINHILVMDNAGIRRFINAKLEEDRIISNFTSKYISDALLNQQYSKISALCLAVSEGHDNIALFLLNNVNVHLKPNNIDDFIALLVSKKNKHCTLCSTYHYLSVRVMPQIIEMVKRVDCNKLQNLFFCEDYPKYNIFSLSFMFAESTFHLTIMDTILKHTDSTTLVKVMVELKCGFHKSRFDARPFLHYLVEVKENLKHLKYMITKLNQKHCVRVFCSRDESRRVPAHFAALYHNVEFFDIMLSHVGKVQFKRICTLKDVHGTTPLRCFGNIFFVFDKFKIICAKAGTDIDVREGRVFFV